MKYCLAIDVGATNIRVAIINKKNKIVFKTKENSKQNKDLAELIFEIYKKMNFDGKLSKVSVGIAGSVDSKSGFINDLPGLNIKNYDLKTKLKIMFKTNIFINNDANLAALAEYHYYKKYNPFQYITISSGIGSGLILNGKLYKGSKGIELEVGRTIIKNNSSFESLCSGAGLTNRLIKEGFDLKYPSEALIKNKNKYKKVIDEWLNDLAIGFANIINSFDPKVIVVGGGLGQYLNYYKPTLLEKMKLYLDVSILENLIIEVSKLNDDNVLIGASYINGY